MKATAVVLAGGESRRMGVDKAFLRLGGLTLIGTVLRVLDGLFAEILVSAPPTPEYMALGRPIIPDTTGRKGPVSGLHAGLLNASHENVFLCACDMPLMKPKLVRFLHAIAVERGTVVPRSPSGLEPLFAFYAKSCLPKVEDLLHSGSYGLHQLPGILGAEIVPFEAIESIDPDAESFFNVNTPSDYEKLVVDFRARGDRII